MVPPQVPPQPSLQVLPKQVLIEQLQSGEHTSTQTRELSAFIPCTALPAGHDLAPASIHSHLLVPELYLII